MSEYRPALHSVGTGLTLYTAPVFSSSVRFQIPVYIYILHEYIRFFVSSLVKFYIKFTSIAKAQISRTKRFRYFLGILCSEVLLVAFGVDVLQITQVLIDFHVSNGRRYRRNDY